VGALSAQNVTVINNYGNITDTTSKEAFVLKSVSEHTYIINEFELANTGVRSHLQQMIKYGLRSYIDSQIQVYEGQIMVNEDLEDFDLAAKSIVSNAIWIQDLSFAEEFDGFSDVTLRQLLAIYELDGDFVDEIQTNSMDAQNGQAVSLYAFQRMVFELKVRMERDINDFLDIYLPYPGQRQNNEIESPILPEKNYSLETWDQNTEELLGVEPEILIEKPKRKKEGKEDEQLELSKKIVELLQSNNQILARHDQRFDEMQRQIDEIKNEKSNDQNAYIEGEIAELRELIMDLSVSDARQNSAIKVDETPVVVIFEKNEHSLSLANQALLNAAVNQLRSDTSLHGMITGFADKTGNAEFNAWISKKRAEAVRAYLVNSGISKQRLEVNFLGDTESSYANPADRKVTVEFVRSEMSNY
jgi:outer membrane protein OmpA-like peptidoglycan-associated protein